MPDGRSRVTVVGERRRIDVALPSAAPIGEYSARLARLCGQPQQRGGLAAAWSLAAAGTPPLSLSASLADSGVADGQVLYLRDLARDPADDVTVADIDELVTDAAAAQRRNTWPRPYLLLCFGLAWLTATALVVLPRAAAGMIGAAIVLAAAGLLLLAVGWSLAVRRTLAPALAVVTSLTSIPCLAVAGGLLGVALAGPHLLWFGAVAGAVAAVLMSLAATPEPVVVLVATQLGVALVLAALLTAVHADAAQAAATTVVAMLCVVGLSKVAAAAVTVWSHRQDARSVAGVTALLIRSRRLLTALLTGPALALAVSLAVLARSGTGFALAMAGAGSVALLVRAQQAGFTDELVPLGGAGLVGLFAVLSGLAERIWPGDTAATVVLAAAGLALVAAAAVATATKTEEAPADLPAGFPVGAGRPDRHRFVNVIGAICMVVTVCLALGVFGVLGDLMGMGRQIVG